MLKFFIKALLLGFIFSPLSLMAQENSPKDHDNLLFVLYDTGEVNAFNPVMDTLTERGIPYKIFAFGKAHELLKDNPNMVDLVQTCKLSSSLSDLKREDVPNNQDIRALASCVSPKTVISSMASKLQGVLLTLFKTRNAYTIAYYDNFDSVLEKDYVKPFLETSPLVDEYILPSTTTKDGFEILFKDSRHPPKFSILGQPSLESWQKVHQSIDLMDLRKKLNLSEKSRPVILFAGGYDDTYEPYIRLFIRTLKNLPVLGYITPHPKTDGSLERRVFEEEGSPKNIRIFTKEEQTSGFSTLNLSTLSKALVCHKSTVCTQALAVGIPAIYLAGKDDYTNFTIIGGISNQAETQKEFEALIMDLLSPQKKSPPSLEKLGIPKNATENITNHLIEIKP